MIGRYFSPKKKITINQLCLQSFERIQENILRFTRAIEGCEEIMWKRKPKRNGKGKKKKCFKIFAPIFSFGKICGIIRNIITTKCRYHWEMIWCFELTLDSLNSNRYPVALRTSPQRSMWSTRCRRECRKLKVLERDNCSFWILKNGCGGDWWNFLSIIIKHLMMMAITTSELIQHRHTLRNHNENNTIRFIIFKWRWIWSWIGHNQMIFFFLMIDIEFFLHFRITIKHWALFTGTKHFFLKQRMDKDERVILCQQRPRWKRWCNQWFSISMILIASHGLFDEIGSFETETQKLETMKLWNSPREPQMWC